MPTTTRFALLPTIAIILLHSRLTASQVATAARLVGGESSREGRVEILYEGVWGTICSDDWTDNDATVICRMIGFTGTGRAIPYTADFYPPGPSSEPVWLRVVQCTGVETVISDCPYELNAGRCNHTEDAGAICLGDLLTTIPTTTIPPTTTTLPPRICNNPATDVRLLAADGTVAYAAGRVQVLYQNVWKSICDDQWGSQDAEVVCSMLCFNPANARAILSNSLYGNATEGYWLTDVQCHGTETDIANCQHSNYGAATPCDITQAAAVSCLPDTPTTPSVPTPVIVCSNNAITAEFSRAADPILQPQDLSVLGPNGQSLSCNATTGQNSTYVFISIPFVGSCNTNRTTNSTYITYTNVIIYSDPPTSPVITRTNTYNVTVSCSLPRAVDPENGFNPQPRTAPPSTGTGQFTVAINFYTNNHFQTILSSGSAPVVQVALGDWLYVAVQLLTSDPTLKLVLNQCYVSPGPDAASTPQYFLIGESCPVESTVTIYPLNNTMVGFQFESFQFLSNITFTYMYLHCVTYTCALTETTGNCNPSCVNQAAATAAFSSTSTGRRRRRQVADGTVGAGVEYDVITGPFWVVLTDDPAATSLNPPSVGAATSTTAASAGGSQRQSDLAESSAVRSSVSLHSYATTIAVTMTSYVLSYVRRR